jgi:phenylalanyl-tRNA synthetase beta chain
MDAHACPFYSVRFFDLIQVNQVSSLLSRRLESIGVRSINNIVDITNYVMMETGQPLHAFDAKKIQGTLTVRFARQGETLEALDGVTYHLRSSDLIIADEKGAQALAGILGGMASGVRESTESILLESAVFNPSLIRASACFHGLRTDASYRFERGSHAVLASEALERATSLIKECSQNAVVHEITVIGSLPPATLLPLRYDRVRSLLGISLEDEEISSLLTKIGCTLCEHWWRIPSWRLDLTREVDLIEEVIRLYGIEQIVPRYMSTFSASSLADRDYDGMMLLRRRLMASGFCEVRTNALVAPEITALQTIRLRNPMGEEQSGLRTSLLPGLKAVIEHNLCQGAKGLKIFELGKVFVKCAENTSAQEESLSLGLIMTGEAESSSWRGGVRRSLDLYDLKGALDALLPGKITYHPSVRPLPEVMAIAMDLFCDDLYCGYIGCLSPKEARKFMLSGQNDALIVAQLELTPLLQALDHGAWKKEGPLPIFPSMTRDLAVVVAKSISYHALEEVLLAQQEPSLKNILPVDIFTDDTGEKISAQHKSLTLQLTFQDEHRTLTTQEVNTICERMIAVLKESFDLAIRS